MIAIYARQSVEKKDSISIESQIEYAKHEVFSDDFKIYQDSGFSGKNTNRPAFMEMMHDIEAGRIEKVVVYRLDRISRSIVDFADFIDVLKTTAFPSFPPRKSLTLPLPWDVPCSISLLCLPSWNGKPSLNVFVITTTPVSKKALGVAVRCLWL